MQDLIQIIESTWENRDLLKEQQNKEAVREVIALLDSGKIRVAERITQGEWKVNDWIKKAILLYFPISENKKIMAGDLEFFDKIPTKKNYEEAGVRAVPHAIARYGSFVESGAILMPSYVNIGAYVGSGSMIDTWATVGSCAQVGKNVHIAGGVGIGGVLEPPQAAPNIIEDNCFIGARSEVAEGVIVGEGAVLSMGVYLGASTKIIDRATGEIHVGRVPPYAVVVPGALPGRANPDGSPSPSLYCAVIVKTVDAQTRSKTSINELLRD